mgnify:CR=1 FL=1
MFDKKNNYEELSLEIVKQSDILKSEDFKVLTDLKDELKDVFLHTQIFRTRTEMEISVLNDLKFPTPDSKYWQAIREQNTMFSELVMLSYEYRKMIIEIKQSERNLKNTSNDDLEKELIKVEIEKKTFQLRNMERVAKDRIRELREWHEIKETLKPNMECSLTNVNDHQLVSYTKRWVNQTLTMKDKGSVPERANLLGQLDSGLKKCQQKGLIEKVLPQQLKEKIIKLIT